MHPSKAIPTSTRLVQLAAMVLIFHIAHSLLQEEVFHLPGFHHTLLLSFLQACGIAAFASIDYLRQHSASSSMWCSSCSSDNVESGGGSSSSSSSNPPSLFDRKTPLKYYIGLSVLALIASFATNEASLRLNYPTQVIFKSSKLLAVMALRSVLMQHKGKLSMLDLGSAVAVVVGLSAFTFATHEAKKQGLHAVHDGGDLATTTTAAAAHLVTSHGPEAVAMFADFTLGIVAVFVAVAADALLYIVEEKYCFHTFGSSSGEIIVYLNFFAALNAGFALTISGKLPESIDFISATGVLLPIVGVYSLCNFIGTTAILTVVSEFGSPSAIIVTNTRKVLTILGSYVVYTKPFGLLHGVGLALVSGGIYVHEVARKKKALPRPDEDDEPVASPM